MASGPSNTIDQTKMRAIFSQLGFDGAPVDIRFSPSRLIVAPKLLVIDNQADLTALAELAPDPAPTVDAFFVDQINFCGFETPTISGLFLGRALLPGHVF